MARGAFIEICQPPGVVNAYDFGVPDHVFEHARLIKQGFQSVALIFLTLEAQNARFLASEAL